MLNVVSRGLSTSSSESLALEVMGVLHENYTPTILFVSYKYTHACSIDLALHALLHKINIQCKSRPFGEIETCWLNILKTGTNKVLEQFADISQP